MLFSCSTKIFAFKIGCIISQRTYILLPFFKLISSLFWNRLFYKWLWFIVFIKKISSILAMGQEEQNKMFWHFVRCKIENKKVMFLVPIGPTDTHLNNSCSYKLLCSSVPFLVWATNKRYVTFLVYVSYCKWCVTVKQAGKENLRQTTKTNIWFK